MSIVLACVTLLPVPDRGLAEEKLIKERNFELPHYYAKPRPLDIPYDPVRTRRVLMRGINAQARILETMLYDEEPFDPPAARIALEIIVKNADDFRNRFPEGSIKGDTRARIDIVQNPEDFEDRIDDLIDDARATMTASRWGEDLFKKALYKTLQHCQGCHDIYRKALP